MRSPLSRLVQRALTALLAASALLFGCVPAAIAQTNVPPSGDVGTSVVGGTPASQYYPGLAAVEYDSPEFNRDDWQTCTSTLIQTEPARTGEPTRAEWAVTAAHCVTNLPLMAAESGLWPRELYAPPVQQRQFQLRVGSVDRTQVPALAVSAIVVNPWWEWIPGGPKPVEEKSAADFALVRLAQPVTLPTSQRPAQLATTEPRPGTPVRMVGWGRTSNGSVLVAAVSRGGAEACGITPDAQQGVAYFEPWVRAVTSKDSKLRTDLPLTDAMGGPIGHPTIRITTTEPVKLRDRLPQFAV